MLRVESFFPLVAAFLSALFAALVAIFTKAGVEGVPSNLATFIRTAFVLPLTMLVVFASGQWTAIGGVSRRSILFLALSALAAGASWLFYYYALGHAPVKIVTALDKLSGPLTIIFALILFGEGADLKTLIALGLITAGSLLMVL